MQDDNDEYRPALDINVTTRRCYSRRLSEMLRKHTGLRVLICRLVGGQWVATVEARRRRFGAPAGVRPARQEGRLS